jgi:hypothetical protein
MSFIYSIYPCPAETLRGSNLFACFSLLIFTLCHFKTKMGSIFIFWTVIVFLNQSSDFCPRMAKMGVC